MSPWVILGIESSADPAAIKRAYATRLKQIDRERDLAGFQNLRGAYEWALQVARARAASEPQGASDVAHEPTPMEETVADVPSPQSDSVAAAAQDALRDTAGFCGPDGPVVLDAECPNWPLTGPPETERESPHIVADPDPVLAAGTPVAAVTARTAWRDTEDVVAEIERAQRDPEVPAAALATLLDQECLDDLVHADQVSDRLLRRLRGKDLDWSKLQLLARRFHWFFFEPITHRMADRDVFDWLRRQVLLDWVREGGAAPDEVRKAWRSVRDCDPDRVKETQVHAWKLIQRWLGHEAALLFPPGHFARIGAAPVQNSKGSGRNTFWWVLLGFIVLRALGSLAP